MNIELKYICEEQEHPLWCRWSIFSQMKNVGQVFFLYFFNFYQYFFIHCKYVSSLHNEMAEEQRFAFLISMDIG